MPPITQIDVDLCDVQLPCQAAGVVLAQSYLALTPHEPYRCTAESKRRHLKSIEAALQVARARSHGAPKTHFTVFPEYSIPIPEGVSFIEESLKRDDWPNQTIVIGGLEGLSIEDYVTLAHAPDTSVHDHPNSVPDREWLNCAIVWAKRGDGRVERWLQPKLSPSWPEQNVNNNHMFEGSSVYVFNGPFEDGARYRFAVLICFDWIATVDGKRPWRSVVDAMAQDATERQADLSLSWLFVIQNNPKPSHATFMTEVNRFFDNSTNRNVRRDRTCLVFVNSAGLDQPGKTDLFGRTSVIFSEQTSFAMPKCYGTFCSGGPRFRGHDIIRPHKDFLFRESGSCIHSFQQLNPDSAIPGPAGRSIALRNPVVHPNGGPSGPRTPADVVPASVKWLNDELDTIPNLAERYPHVPLSQSVQGFCGLTIDELRQFPGSAVECAIELASPDALARRLPDGSRLPADDWTQAQRDAVGHVLHTAVILGLCTTNWTIEQTHPTLRYRLEVTAWT